jgi:hypothetical protein
LIPATASFVFIDVLALVIASTTASILTTLWVWKDPEFQPSFSTAERIEQNKSKFFCQKRVGGESNSGIPGSHFSKTASIGPRISSSDNSMVAQRITELLEIAKECPSTFATHFPWSEKLLRTAMDMWRDGSICITLSNRQLFVKTGFEDSWTFVVAENNTMSITAGFLDAVEIEFHMTRWSDSLAYL